jgi:hypothetical protein
MKLSDMNPIATNVGGAPEEITEAVAQATNSEEFREVTHHSVATQPDERDTRPLHPDPEQFKLRYMTEEECFTYADQGVVKVMRARLVEFNTMITALQASEDTILEWEAIHMMIAETEKFIAAIPGYKDIVHRGS